MSEQRGGIGMFLRRVWWDYECCLELLNFGVTVFTERREVGVASV